MHRAKIIKPVTLTAIFILLIAGLVHAQVLYQKGSRTINGVLLLQDANDENRYYYVPPYPRLSPLPEGGFEFLAVKFVDPDGDTNGGLLHFLVQYDLPDDELEALKSALKKVDAGAEIVGPVPMSPPAKDKKENPSFKVVSAVLTDTEGGMTRKLISSGAAPLTPGSKSAVAAILNQEGATLLWDTLDGQTSDISITISGSYEAVVEGYNARIHAEMSTVYTHVSNIINKTKGYKKREMRDIVDEMIRDSVITVEIFDRSESLGTDAGAMSRITDLCTDKLVNLMFDHETGLSKLPEREEAVQQGQIKGRQEKGWLATLFTGTGDQPYYTDNQYVLKNREDISQSVFNINLSGKTTISVPFNTSGNMRGFYTANKDNPEMFRIVNLADPSFQKREIHFTIDRDYIDAFRENINFVTINFRKKYVDQPETTREIQFTHEEVAEGKVHKFVTYPRLGIESSDWLDYEYRISWSIFGKDTVKVPADDTWLTAGDAVINLVPPFDKSDIEVECDRSEFQPNNVQTGVLEVKYSLLGEEKQERMVTIREKDTEPFNSFTIYHDKGKTPLFRLTWYGKAGSGKKIIDWADLDSSFIFVSPPEFEVEEKENQNDEGKEP